MTDSIDSLLADLPEDATLSRDLLEYVAAHRDGQDSFSVPDQGALLSRLIGAVVSLDRRVVEQQLLIDDLQIRVDDLEDRR